MVEKTTTANISKHVTENDQTTQIFIPRSLGDHRDHLTKGDNPLLFHFAVERRGLQFPFDELKYQDDENFPIEIHPILPETITTDIINE